MIREETLWAKCLSQDKSPFPSRGSWDDLAPTGPRSSAALPPHPKTQRVKSNNCCDRTANPNPLGNAAPSPPKPRCWDFPSLPNTCHFHVHQKHLLEVGGEGWEGWEAAPQQEWATWLVCGIVAGLGFSWNSLWWTGKASGALQIPPWIWDGYKVPLHLDTTELEVSNLPVPNRHQLQRNLSASSWKPSWSNEPTQGKGLNGAALPAGNIWKAKP